MTGLFVSGRQFYDSTCLTAARRSSTAGKGARKACEACSARARVGDGRLGAGNAWAMRVGGAVGRCGRVVWRAEVLDFDVALVVDVESPEVLDRHRCAEAQLCERVHLPKVGVRVRGLLLGLGWDRGLG